MPMSDDRGMRCNCCGKELSFLSKDGCYFVDMHSNLYPYLAKEYLLCSKCAGFLQNRIERGELSDE